MNILANDHATELLGSFWLPGHVGTAAVIKNFTNCRARAVLREAEVIVVSRGSNA